MASRIALDTAPDDISKTEKNAARPGGRVIFTCRADFAGDVA
jgi:hypothetical protein